MRLRTFSDLKLDPGRIVAPAGYLSGLITIEGLGPFEMAGNAMAFTRQGPCPICAGGPLRRSHYCLGCDRCGLDGRVELPGLGVDEAPDPEWKADPTSYDPDPLLKGGRGGKASRTLKARLAARRTRTYRGAS